MTVEIEIGVQAGTITLNDNLGNIRGPEGMEVMWYTNDPKREFTLHFFDLQCGCDDSPFSCGSSTKTVSKGNPFRGLLKKRSEDGQLGMYKYSVSTGGLVLDPILIVDKNV